MQRIEHARACESLMHHPARHQVGQQCRHLPRAEHRRAHAGKHGRRQPFQCMQRAFQHGPRRMRIQARFMQVFRILRRQPLPRQRSAVDWRRHVGAQVLQIIVRRALRENTQTPLPFLPEPERGLERRAEKYVVVQVQEAFGQARNMVQIRFDMTGVEHGQGCIGHQARMVDHRQAR
ncbi:hypothetical protein D3C72_1484210 [compost metagenome]